MQKRAIRILKHIGATPCVAICTLCSEQFKASDIRSLKEATASLQSQFDAHKCELTDSSSAGTLPKQ
jgi:hypothetical protein